MEQIEVPQTLRLNDPICDPLTVQLSEKEPIPFKVIVKCERTELTLSSFQRPVTISDQLIFSLMNERNHDSLKKEIGDYKTQLQINAQDAQNLQDNFEATCKIFLGTQYLGQNDQKIKLQAQERQQESQIIRHDNIQSEIGRNVSNPSVIATGRNPQNEPLNVQRQSTMVRNKHVLVCGLYENQTPEEIKDFFRAFYNQNVDIVVVVNGLKSLNKALKKELLSNPEAKLHREIESNKFSVNNALVMQYSISQNTGRIKSFQSCRSSSDTMPKIIFLIKYLKSSYFDIQKWIYGGVAKHFDPDYFYVTKCSNIPYPDAIQKQISILNHEKLCGVTSNVLTKCQSSWNPLNHVNAFLLNQTSSLLENQPINKLFSVSMDHDPLFCFYRWQEAKPLMETYLFKIAKSESDITQNIIVQGVNCILPFIAAEKGLYFAKNDAIVASTQFKTSLSTMMEEQRKRNNAQWYSSHLFWKTYQYGSSKWKLNIFVRIIQTCILLFRAMLQQLDNYFGVAAITFIICQSSYQFFGTGVHFTQDQMVQMIVPALFLFALIVYVVFANVFNGSQILATSRYLEPITIEGKLVCYLTQMKTTNEISLYLERGSESEQDCKIIQNTKLLQVNEIKLAGYFVNKKLTITLSYQNQRYVASPQHSQAILDQIKDEIVRTGFHRGANLEQTQRVKNELKEAFLSLRVSNMCFQYANNINEAASSYEKLFYVLAILNVSLLVMFILNIVMSHFVKLNSTYVIMICACFLIMILQKLILILLNPSNFSNFVKGYMSYIFYYLVVTFGMKFYEMANIDRNYENVRLDRFYYDKVQTIGLWVTYNVAFLFICFMIEAYYNYCGYVLLAFLMYYGVSAALEILGLILAKCFSTSEKKNQDLLSAADTSVNSNQQYSDDDFKIDQEDKYENVFLKKQIEASEQYYEMQLQQTRFIKKSIEEQLEQTKKLFETMQISKRLMQQQQPNQNNQTQQFISKHFLPTIAEEKLKASGSVGQSSHNFENSNMLQSNKIMVPPSDLKTVIPNISSHNFENSNSNILQSNKIMVPPSDLKLVIPNANKSSIQNENDMLQSNKLDSVGSSKDSKPFFNQKN